ncbi:MAG: hypothetical protein U5R31_01495 [Acidimicrobiia bacterium]|nr:hypothetical protein [Acidimicrobiia bacterium]
MRATVRTTSWSSERERSGWRRCGRVRSSTPWASSDPATWLASSRPSTAARAPYDAVAAKDVEALAVSREDFEQFLLDFPGAAIVVLRVVADRLRDANGAGNLRPT